ncbi:MAG: ribonuclease J [Candidatus Paceibacterota bacterium]
MQKNRLSFSAVSIDNTKKEERKHTDAKSHPRHTGTHSNGERKKLKSSTFQYSKFGKKGRGAPRSKFGNAPMMRKNDSSTVPPPAPGVIRVIPLGGVEEIGKNMTAIEIGDDIIVIDAGMHFSNEDTPGVDYMIPNTTYLEERKDKIRALFVTHGHLDHIGGVPIVLSRIGNPPVYSRNLSILLMRKRQAEFPHLPKMNENIVEKDSVITVGNMRIKFFGVTHTIPDSMGIIIETPHGMIVTPGDYKLDQVDGVVSKEEEKEYAIFDNQKVLLLLTDSTNIENEGYALPEIKVHQGLENLIRRINGRIIIAAFASHITRLAHVVKTAESLGKKVALDGRSMKTNIEVAIEANYFVPKKETIIPIDDVDKYPPNKVIILMTGAQGEEFAALNRAANKSHAKFSLHKGDTIILSASIVPGNERAVERMKDGLARQGVRIITYRTPGEDYVHATGHGNKEDVRWLHRKTHPKFFIPIHGNHYRLQLHKELAVELGAPEENVIVPDNGTIIEVSADGEKIYARKEKAPSGLMMVDGISVGDDQDVVIRDRVMLAQDGMFVIITVVDQKTGRLKKSPDLISRGFVYLKENQELLRQVRILIKKSVEDITIKNPAVDLDYIKANLGENISKYLYQKTSKRPLVIPVVLNI